ncbi:MAG: serine/threonine-protein kinase [Gemmatimonadetes bacterium]|nr:serine/threonine-protein kinase [Gemmatimonadota bacterium]
MTDPLASLSAALTGRYVIERELGAGGMATVYLAEDTKHHRHVAVKVLRAELAASLGAERFLREIGIAARLHHPHILSLYDSGGEGDVLYYVMPFVDGQSLRDRIVRTGALPIDEAVRIIREVADALEYSHQQGVVHRDIKPENVLIAGAHAMVTDFGVAKAVSDASGTGPLTATGMAVGTPSYMAPEQITADPALDHRVDIYALGVLAYEILAGRAPFLGTNLQQVIAGHLAQRPDPLTVHRPAASPALEAVVMRCLEKNPADRWQSAGDIVRALDALAKPSGELSATSAGTPAGAPVVAGASTARTASGASQPAAPSGASGRKRAVVGGAIIGAALLIGGIAWSGQVGRAGTMIGDDLLAENDVVLVAEFENRTTDSTLAATVTDAVRVELQQSRAVRVMSQAAMWAGLSRMGLARGTALPGEKVQELAEREGAKAYVVGDIARIGGGFQVSARVVATAGGNEALTARATAATEAELIGAVEDVGRQLRRGIGESLRSVMAAPALAKVTTASLPALRAYTAASRAENAGDRPKAIAMAKAALALDSTFAATWSLLTVSYTNMGALTLATDAAERAYSMRDRLTEFERLRAEARYHGTRNNAVAEEAAWARLAEMGRDESNYANMLMEQGRLAEAEVMARRAVVSNPKSAIAWWNLAETQVALQEFAAADSTATAMAAQIPADNAYRLWIPFGILVERRDFDEVEAALRSGPLAGYPDVPNLKCLMDLQRGRLRAWRRCAAHDELVEESAQLPLTEFRVTGDTASARRAYGPFLAAKRDERDLDRYASIIPLLADVGRVRDARALLDEWRDRSGPTSTGYRADSALAVGAIAAAEERWDAAVAAFLAWNAAPMPSAFHYYSRGLPEAATILKRIGQTDSSIVLFERALARPSLARGPDYEAGWYSEALQMLGEMYEARGDRTKAAEYYGKYVELLDGADAALQPQVAAVKEQLRRVTSEPGARRPSP